MPYDTYRLHQIERGKSPAEVRRADEQAARVASDVSSLLRGITRPARAVRRPFPATAPRPDPFWLLTSVESSVECVPDLPGYGGGMTKGMTGPTHGGPPNHGDPPIPIGRS